jgi:chromate transporter
MVEDPELSADVNSRSARIPLGELARFFLRLGTTAFGGPAAHIAIMEDELVRRRRWLPREQFLDLLGVSNLIPGPSSSELAIHIGYLCGGWRGLLTAGICFILPAAITAAFLASLYVRFGKLPAAAAVLDGVKPVVIAVIAQALWGLARTAVKNTFLAWIALLALVLCAFGIHPLLLLLLAGIAACASQRKNVGASFRFFAETVVGGTAVSTTAAFSLASLFLVFLKIGAVTFGSGYVLLAFLRSDLVIHRGWLTDAQLVDAVAAGQVTPGPVFTTATFIGFLLGGMRGAILATIAIFSPAFILVAASAPLIPRIRESKTASAFIDGVNTASLALMATVSWQLARASLVGIAPIIVAIISLVALLRYKINSAWLILAGAIVGMMTHR